MKNADNNDGVFTVILPADVKGSFSKYSTDIHHYGIFIENNQIYSSGKRKEGEKNKFRSVSNFAVEILKQLLDEKFPKKLLRIRNIEGIEKEFEIFSDSLYSFSIFKKTLSSQGNFVFSGDKNDLRRLLAFLFDKFCEDNAILVEKN